MLCIISYTFLFIVIAQSEAGTIGSFQTILYGIYGLIMAYHTGKKYWDYDEYEKNRRK